MSGPGRKKNLYLENLYSKYSSGIVGTALGSENRKFGDKEGGDGREGERKAFEKSDTRTIRFF